VAHPAPYPMDIEGYFLCGKAADSFPSTTEVKQAWTYTFTPPYVLMACA
jgi:hypothetical protein